MFVGGLTLVFINPIRDYFVKRSADKLSLENYTVEQIKENEQQENDVDFEFEAVQSLSIADVLRAQASAENYPVIGSIVVPSVDMEVPILKGVSNSALAVGAGTMKPDQKLGTGNYALAGHYIEGRDVLFGPLYHAELGDSIFLTDLDQIYEYKINHKETIAATDVHVIDDRPGQTKLTLITCADSGYNRLAVEADFVISTNLNFALAKNLFESLASTFVNSAPASHETPGSYLSISICLISLSLTIASTLPIFQGYFFRTLGQFLLCML